ncbi:hypothetical protein EYF80_031304 [Liparis tanakae]|uniref:Uncharacterized protein n=1 Tax=Liparis tanakae TaxID=230148 RepID=A0A4Z2GYX8_9TELE|nr:hypothetical protein EYF80_031304 [Liparis tanakae]
MKAASAYEPSFGADRHYTAGVLTGTCCICCCMAWTVVGAERVWMVWQVGVRTRWCWMVIGWSCFTLETGAGALVADDGALDETGLSAVGGDHHSLGRLGLDGHARLAVGLNQRVDREALGLHGDALGVHLRKDWYLDGGLGRVLWLRLDGLHHLRPWLEERRAAVLLLLRRRRRRSNLLLHRGYGRGGVGLCGREGRGEGHRPGRQRLGDDEADGGALVHGGGRRLGGRRGLNGRARSGGGGTRHRARRGHLILEQVGEVAHLVTDKLQHL